MQEQAVTIVRDVVHGGERIVKSMPPTRYPLLSADELLNAAPLKWLIRGVIPAASFVALFGPSGSGKSFLALDICAAVANGDEWFGKRVEPAPVTYCALEGAAGMSKRARALAIQQRRPLPADLRFITQAIDLQKEKDVHDLAEAVTTQGGENGLLVIDTLNRAASGVDENASTGMGVLIGACKELMKRTGCTVLVVHHTGKDSAKGLRGHSSLFAALDSAIEVTRSSDRREWSVAKSKDDADGEKNGFVLKVVELDGDDAEEPVTSCVIVSDDRPATVAVPKPRGKTQELVYAVMKCLLSESTHSGEAGAPEGRPCVEIDEVVPVIAERLVCRVDQRDYQTRRALDAMTGPGRIYEQSGGWIWHQ
jgi:putative DNA primase/helicase